ncbi:MAG: hypothetical protein OEU36_25400 [Gammaproteobacteria bacterium]|nr:hypothetical protein [Gammaproteobacteria bacterium]
MPHKLDMRKLRTFNPSHQLMVARMHDLYRALVSQDVGSLTDTKRDELKTLEAKLQPYFVDPRFSEAEVRTTDSQNRREAWQTRPWVELNREIFDKLSGAEKLRVDELSRALPLAEAELENYSDLHPTRQHQAMKVENLREQLRPYRKQDD